MLDQKPTVTPRLFSPVTWVCTEPGKFSLLVAGRGVSR